MPIVKICSEPGCRTRFAPNEGKRGRCPQHAVEHERKRTVRRRTDEYHQQILATPQWRKARDLVRERDVTCQHRSAGRFCGGRLEVHHVKKVKHGGEPFDPDNLVLLCQHHHRMADKEYEHNLRFQQSMFDRGVSAA